MARNLPRKLKKREQEEQGNAMKKLENRTMDNKMEMDILDGLDEIREINAKISKIDPVDVLDQLHEKEAMRDPDEDLEEDEKELLRSMLQKVSEPIIKRLEDDFEPTDSPLLDSPSSSSERTTEESIVEFKVPAKKKKGKSGIVSIQASTKPGAPPLLIKFQPKSRETTLVKTSASPTENQTQVVGSLAGFGDYGALDD